MRALIVSLIVCANPAFSEGADDFGQVAMVCEFENIPPVVLSYSRQSTELVGTMTVGGRGPVVLNLGAGSARFESGDLDGYHFRWSPSNSWMVVERDKEIIRSSQGTCKPTDFGNTSTQLAFAELDKDPVIFSAEEQESIDRVTDAIMGQLFPGEKDDGNGSWSVFRSTNPLDDTSIVTLIVTAETGHSRAGEPVRLAARCKSNKTEVFAVWNDYLGDDSGGYGDPWKTMEIRIGDDPSETQQWSLSTDKEATFAPYWAGGLLKKMLDEDRLVLRTVPYNETPITAVFDIRGLRTVLHELADTCNWSF